MNKLAFVFLFFAAPVFSQAWKDAPVVAEKVVYACQYTASAGLKWENGKWLSTRFQLDAPFFLTSANNTLVPWLIAESIFPDTHLSFDCGEPNVVKRGQFDASNLGLVQTCSTKFGHMVYFDFDAMIGTVASNRPKSKIMSTFICTKVK